MDPSSEMPMIDLRPFKSERDEVKSTAAASAAVVRETDRLAVAGLMP